jgi:hypothetical protein
MHIDSELADPTVQENMLRKLRDEALAEQNKSANVKADALAWEQQDPLNHIPHGDRLLVRVLSVDDVIELSNGAKLWRPEKSVIERGYVPAVIVNVGSGHRLDTPDRYVTIKLNVSETTPQQLALSGVVLHDTTTGDTVVRVPSSVPMPFQRGEVWAIPRMTGIEVELRGKHYRVVNQSECLWKYQGVTAEVP